MRRMDGGVIPPTAERLREIAHEYRFEISDEEMVSFQGLIEGTLPAYRRVAELVEPQPVVKYPRTPGHRPMPDENKHHAWFWKCDVRGSGKGRLANKRIAVKDPVAVAGVPMMIGSAVMEGFVPQVDATIVTRMLDEGGIIAGKAACEDLSLSGGAVTCNPVAPMNPVKPGYSAGGSSGGSAALLAAGEVDFAIGSDQGGSTRIPAALCGVVGLKATYGLVPATGVFPLENTIDHVCPMARTAADVARLLSVIAGNDELDPRMRHNPEPKDYTKALCGNVEGLHIAIVREGFGWAPEAETTDGYVRAAAKKLEKAGAKVSEISLPVHRDAGVVYTPLLMDGIARQLFKGNGFGMGWRGYYPTDWIDYYGKARKSKANSYSHLCKFVLLLGEYMNDEYNGRFYAKAQNVMRWCQQKYDEALSEYNLLVMPTCAPLAQALPQQRAYSAEEYVPACFSHHLNTGQFNGTGHPAISVNAGNLDGLPVGMMLVGKWFDEDTVLRAADAYEKLT